MNEPLSHYLFVICMELLSQKIIRVVDEGHQKPIGLSHNGPSISLFFVDDILLFPKVSSSRAGNISDILYCFSMFSNLKVNVLNQRCYSLLPLRRVKWI